MPLADLAAAASLALATTFTVAGLVKLARPAQTRRAMVGLDLPGPEVLTYVVPSVELVTATSLVTVPATGAIVALALLAFFSTLLTARIRSGSSAPCGCFGTVATDPIGVVDLARNALLGVLGATALAADTGLPRPSLLAAIVVVAFSAVSVLVLERLRRQQRRRRRDAAGAPPATELR